MASCGLTCPACGHEWEDDYVCGDVVSELEEQLEALAATMEEMRDFMKGIVDEFDKVPATYSINRVLTKAEIQKMRRLIGE